MEQNHVDSRWDELRGTIEFDGRTTMDKELIKIIGVGGGGSNAVTHMVRSGAIPGVSHLLCNTDEAHIRKCGLPNYVVLGPKITEGNGAGDKPEVAAAAARESRDELLSKMKDEETKMVIVTATLGGGTGTGAAPIICEYAQELGLLTVAIVTIPFAFEGVNKITKALKALKEMRAHTDTMLVINNEHILDIYGDLEFRASLKKADDILKNAAKGLSDINNITGTTNVDFNDIKTTLTKSGVSVINTGYATGEGRLSRAIDDAINSPLLNNNNLVDAQRVLINVYTRNKGIDEETGEEIIEDLPTREMKELTQFMQSFENRNINVIYGVSSRHDLAEGELAVTVLAAGFSLEDSDSSIRKGLMEDSLHQKEEQIRREQEQKEIDRLYGKGKVATNSQRSAMPFLLNVEDLDDVALLKVMHQEPASDRNVANLEDIRRGNRSGNRGKSSSPSYVPTTSPSKPKAEKQVISGF